MSRKRQEALTNLYPGGEAEGGTKARAFIDGRLVGWKPTDDTVWFKDRKVPVRIGVDTGHVMAYDPSCHLVLIDWETGTRETHELRWFAASFRERVYLALALSRSQVGRK